MALATGLVMSRISPLTSTSSRLGTKLTESRWWNTEAGLARSTIAPSTSTEGAKTSGGAFIERFSPLRVQSSLTQSKSNEWPPESPHVHARHRAEEPRVHHRHDEGTGIKFCHFKLFRLVGIKNDYGRHWRAMAMRQGRSEGSSLEALGMEDEMILEFLSCIIS